MNCPLIRLAVARCRLKRHCMPSAVALVALGFGLASAVAAQTLELIDFSAQRSQVLAQLDHVPTIELRQRYLRCMHVSTIRGLTVGETTICALAAESLRERVFGGDYGAMVIWAESQRDPYLLLLQP